MNRRTFARVLPFLPFIILASGTSPIVPPIAALDRRDPRRVRAIVPRGQPFGHGRLVDAATGQDVSREFSIRATARLRRSLESGRPVRLAVFRLDAAGKHFLDGDRLATRAAWVQVVR